MIGESFGPSLRPHGFLKTRLTWRRDLEGISHVVNVQKSAWDPDPYHCSYYVNLRVRLLTPIEPSASGEISARLESTAPEYDDSLLRFENCDESEAADRIQRVRAIFLEKGLPWILQLSNFEQIRSAYERGMLGSIFVGVDMLKAVGVAKIADRAGEAHEK
jgi:hypothetical protein